ncbi:MAG TPA: GLPGLI family protein [Flavisolibacter sp.]|nr:GLPGLI family protein [Flavisolibacter sp.]
MRTVFFAAILSMVAIAGNAQTFHPQVRIQFEKVVYVRQQYKELFVEWYEEFKNMIPEKVVNQYEFLGDTTQSLFRETKEAVLPPNTWYEEVANKNVVYNHYPTLRTITQKPVAEETFLVEDSLLKIRWKLTNDVRTIAGYDCRKAIGFVDDTLAIFAFYSDELLVQGGPESVHGLPGMILGMGVPRLHATWFATKVEVNGLNLATVKPLAKGKKVSRTQLMTQLDAVLKNWGKYGSSMRLNYLI